MKRTCEQSWMCWILQSPLGGSQLFYFLSTQVSNHCDHIDGPQDATCFYTPSYKHHEHPLGIHLFLGTGLPETAIR